MNVLTECLAQGTSNWGVVCFSKDELTPPWCDYLY